MLTMTSPESSALLQLTFDNGIIQRNLCYFLDANSVLSLSATCQFTRDALVNDNLFASDIWRHLCVSRWRFTGEMELSDCNTGLIGSCGDPPDPLPCPWAVEYCKRLFLDEIAWSKLSSLNESDDARSEQIDKVIDLMKFEGVEVINVIQQSMNSGGIEWRHQALPKAILKGIIRYGLCKTITALTYDAETDISLEDGAILIAHFCETDLFHQRQVNEIHTRSENVEGNYALQYICTQLDGMAQNFKDQLRVRFGNEEFHSETMIILEEMKQFFLSKDAASTVRDAVDGRVCDDSFDGAQHICLDPFYGNIDNYYSSSNSMIHKVLKSRKGIPISLGIIYHAILRRATGIEMDLANLPGHFMLSTTIINERNELERVFVDVYDGGRILSSEDVKSMITTNYNTHWDESYLHPVSKARVWNRMIRNLFNCGDFPNDESKDFINLLFTYRELSRYPGTGTEKLLPMASFVLCGSIKSML